MMEHFSTTFCERIETFGSADVSSPADEMSAVFEGRAAVVHRFERDGRGILVVREVGTPDRTGRALTPLERCAVAYVRDGYSNKRIAIELGYSESRTSGIVQTAARKLGARSRIDLVRLLAAASNPSQARAQRHRIDAVLIHFSLRADPPAGAWTPAEREVATMLVEGASNAEIAERRGTATSTVANQVASILRKARVGSRVELAARGY